MGMVRRELIVKNPDGHRPLGVFGYAEFGMKKVILEFQGVWLMVG
jgi:hypothetical protein